MKKILAIFLLIIYASTAFGTVVSFHYCGKSLIEMSFPEFGAVKSCICDPENGPMDCCTNKLLFQKADNHKSVNSLLIPDMSFFHFTRLPLININLSVDAYNHNEIIRDSFPPHLPGPIYLLDRVIRI